MKNSGLRKARHMLATPHSRRHRNSTGPQTTGCVKSGRCSASTAQTLCAAAWLRQTGRGAPSLPLLSLPCPRAPATAETRGAIMAAELLRKEKNETDRREGVSRNQRIRSLSVTLSLKVSATGAHKRDSERSVFGNGFSERCPRRAERYPWRRALHRQRNGAPAHWSRLRANLTRTDSD